VAVLVFITGEQTMASDYKNKQSSETRRQALGRVRQDFSDLADPQQALLLVLAAQRELLMVLLGIRRTGLSLDRLTQLEQTTHSTEQVFMALVQATLQCIPRANLTVAQNSSLSELTQIPDQVFAQPMGSHL
jgi:hypothetical protein